MLQLFSACWSLSAGLPAPGLQHFPLCFVCTHGRPPALVSNGRGSVSTAKGWDYCCSSTISIPSKFKLADAHAMLSTAAGLRPLALE